MHKNQKLYKKNSTIAKPNIILILGMHRSGTSLVAQIIAKWGAYMGKSLIAADEFNKDGYWENEHLHELNESILESSDGAWFSPPDHIDVDKLVNEFGHVAYQLVDEMDRKKRVWCWKEPRMVVLLDFWKKILEGRNITYIISYRHPQGVAESLLRRDNMPKSISLLLWEYSVKEILRQVNPSDRYLFVEYESLIRDPDTECRKIFEYLNSANNISKDNKVFNEMKLAVKPEYMNSDIKPGSFIMSPFQKNLYKIFKKENLNVTTRANNNRTWFWKDYLEIYRNYKAFADANRYYAQLYIATGDKSFNENNSIRVNITGNPDKLVFNVGHFEHIRAFRFDPLNNYVQMKISNIRLFANGQQVSGSRSFTSKAISGNNQILLFDNQDPQLYFDMNIPEKTKIDQVVISIKYITKGPDTVPIILEQKNQTLSELSKTLQLKREELDEKNSLMALSQNKIQEKEDAIKKQLEIINEHYQKINNFSNELDSQKNILMQKEDIINKLSARIEDQQNEIQRKEQLISVDQETIHLQQQRIKNHTNEILAYKNSVSYKSLQLLNSFFLIFYPKRFIRKLLEVRATKRNLNIIEKSGLFNIKFYLQQNPDVQEAQVNPIWHYLKYGGFERRNPSRQFNSGFYLDANPDVEKSGMNPLVHYIRHRKMEGREALPKEPDYSKADIRAVKLAEPSGSEPKNIQKKNHLQEIQLIRRSDYFDEKYYLATYPNVKAAGVDPVEHYYYNGWKEGRNPSRKFNTNYYLNSNPDIKRSLINPLYNYIVSGVNEGRAILHPCSVKVNQLKKSYQEYNILVNNYNDQIESDNIEVFVKAIINQASYGKKVVFSFSQDKYNEIAGGIQLCIIEEQQAFSSNGYLYIHFSPTKFTYDFFNNDETKDILNVIIDGKLIGRFSASDILKTVEKYFSNINNYMVFHSLHGHDLAFILKLHKAVKIIDSYFWLHNYFSICAGHNLMRNNIVYCGAPDLASNSCELCLYGQNRVEHTNNIRMLFEATKPIINSPSKFTLEFWSSIATYPVKGKNIIEHRTMGEKWKKVKNKKNKEILKIGFVGYPAFHKGWNEFQTLADMFNSTGKYKFYHIGLLDTGDRNIEYLESGITIENPDATLENLKQTGLDYAFIWPQWPETFCLTAFEAILAGALVITNNTSGNVKDMVSKYNRGIVYNHMEDLIEDFESEKLYVLYEGLNKNGVFQPSYEKSQYTYSCLKS
jgi:hypothetical protein